MITSRNIFQIEKENQFQILAKKSKIKIKYQKRMTFLLSKMYQKSKRLLHQKSPTVLSKPA